MYWTREAVEAGGLMSYGADEAESYRRVAYYVDRILNFEGSQTLGFACGAADEVRAGDQSQNCEADWRNDSAVVVVPGGQSDPVRYRKEPATNMRPNSKELGRRDLICSRHNLGSF
jgi:hypothetical protein